MRSLVNGKVAFEDFRRNCIKTKEIALRIMKHMWELNDSASERERERERERGRGRKVDRDRDR